MFPLLLMLLHVTLQQLYTDTSFVAASSNGTMQITANCFSGATGFAPSLPYHWTQLQPNGSLLIGFGFNQDPNFFLQVPTKRNVGLLHVGVPITRPTSRLPLRYASKFNCCHHQ